MCKRELEARTVSVFVAIRDDHRNQKPLARAISNFEFKVTFRLCECDHRSSQQHAVAGSLRASHFEL
jgi:hypothetical protein